METNRPGEGDLSAENARRQEIASRAHKGNPGRFQPGNAGGPGRPFGGRSSSRARILDDYLREYSHELEEGGQGPARALVDIATGRSKGSMVQLLALRILLERVDGRPRLAKERRDETPKLWTILLDQAEPEERRAIEEGVREREAEPPDAGGGGAHEDAGEPDDVDLEDEVDDDEDDDELEFDDDDPRDVVAEVVAPPAGEDPWAEERAAPEEGAALGDAEPEPDHDPWAS